MIISLTIGNSAVRNSFLIFNDFHFHSRALKVKKHDFTYENIPSTFSFVFSEFRSMLKSKETHGWWKGKKARIISSKFIFPYSRVNFSFLSPHFFSCVSFCVSFECLRIVVMTRTIGKLTWQFLASSLPHLLRCCCRFLDFNLNKSRQVWRKIGKVRGDNLRHDFSRILLCMCFIKISWKLEILNVEKSSYKEEPNKVVKMKKSNWSGKENIFPLCVLMKFSMSFLTWTIFPCFHLQNNSGRATFHTWSELERIEVNESINFNLIFIFHWQYFL